MSIQSGLDLLQSNAKDLAKIQHNDATDEQLREIITRNQSAIVGMPQTDSGIVESYKLLGEIQGCSELLSERQAKRDRIKKASEDWKNKREKKKKSEFLYLKNAASPNGQLIAAILEDEDGKTAEELSGWCDELAELPEEELQALLDGLEKEGVLEKDDEDRYRLLCVCTEEPFVSCETGMARADRYYEGDEQEKAHAKRILYILQVNGAPMSPQDCLDEIGKHMEFRSDPRFAAADAEPSEFDVRWTMRSLADRGILSKEYTVEGADYYWFAMLGNRG